MKKKEHERIKRLHSQSQIPTALDENQFFISYQSMSENLELQPGTVISAIMQIKQNLLK